MRREVYAVLAGALVALMLLAVVGAAVTLIGLRADPPQSASAQADGRINISTRCLIGCSVGNVSLAQEQDQRQRQPDARPNAAFALALVAVIILSGGALLLLRG